jgi:Major capsid protein N-terminus/Large eukaryotic DNA virus major capsid protein
MAGIMQLVNKGAQDHLVTGNPSFTHFRSVYKRHTDFAMEHYQLPFRTTNLNLPQAGTLTLTARVERYAQLLNDCYLVLTLPNIYSPVVLFTPGGSYLQFNGNSQAIGYEFAWCRNLGYNMIANVSILINGQEVVTHTGEWMKLYADMNFDANKKALVDQMVGNVPEMYDPANAFDRMNQYPHAISSSTIVPEPSIAGRVLSIPLHFWFCEKVGTALPLVALQYSQVDIRVELRNMYQLFTVREVRPSLTKSGLRIAPDSSSTVYNMSNFLSPPTFSGPTDPNLVTWKMNPYIEANYIFLSDGEHVHIAKTEHSFIIHQLDIQQANGQYGAANDVPVLMKNLCTQLVWIAQRSDRPQLNDYDNYTNWDSTYRLPPNANSFQSISTYFLSSGAALNTNVSQRDILLESNLILDGKDRFSAKPTHYFSQIQNYRHQTGKTITGIPGVYSYSFALDHHTGQPSGHINGSMFNKPILRNTYVQPPLTTAFNTTTTVCVLKSTANSPNPTIVNPNAVNAQGQLVYRPGELVTIIRKQDAQTYEYTYDVRIFVESYNYLRVIGGVASLMFSS